METIETIFLQSAVKRLGYYKTLGEQTFSQLSETDFHFIPNEQSNSIAIIIQHMSGNMLSRWTDFLTTDGEKEWRKRDKEFELLHSTKADLIEMWEKGWNCCLNTIQNLQPTDLLKAITIRSEPLTVVDAINRQLAHYPYHVGQIIYIGKLIKNTDWQNLSMKRNR
ncbi:MAG: DUF1572 family protein [Ferruginibacter sp.]